MHPEILLSPLLAGPNVDLCKQGGTFVVSGFSKMVDIGKYLFGVAVFLTAAIWLVTEFFRDGDRGGSRVGNFLINYQLPLLILFLAIGLLFGFSPMLLGSNLMKPC